MKARDFLFLILLILIAAGLSIALMQYGSKLADAVFREFQYQQDAAEEFASREALLHQYMYPDPVEVEIVGTLPQWVPDGQKFHATRPGE